MKLLIINGPNLNILGLREPAVYGSDTLQAINDRILSLCQELKAGAEFFQSNHEGELVTCIQQAPANGFDGIVINPGAYGHTSIALRDALACSRLPFVEVHISNTFAREEFRHKSYISDLAAGIIIGFGASGYNLAVTALHHLLQRQAP